MTRAYGPATVVSYGSVTEASESVRVARRLRVCLTVLASSFQLVLAGIFITETKTSRNHEPGPDL